MRIRKSIVCSCLVVAALSTSILAAQSAQPRRKPDVPYVPTTDLAVAAMLLGVGLFRMVRYFYRRGAHGDPGSAE